MAGPVTIFRRIPAMATGEQVWVRWPFSRRAFAERVRDHNVREYCDLRFEPTERDGMAGYLLTRID